MRLDQGSINRINVWLKTHYGTDIASNDPCFRVVWAEDQLEKQLDTFTDRDPNGLFVREVKEVREVKKYPHVTGLHILERLFAVPESDKEMLLGKKVSYELLFNFWAKDGSYLPPRIEVCEFVIDCVLSAEKMAKDGRKGYMRKYSEPTREEEMIKRRIRLDKMKDYLWGDSSGLLGETIKASGSSIIMPSNWR